jgi:2-polyprenyl-6-methoxyphenol hydroxylase-like FAD-dependent oxidoreductase
MTATGVIIVGGGPAGLVLAIELGRRDVPCLLFEQNYTPPAFPKANSTTSRTMEHYRRLGIADEVRRLGLPEDYAPDISYHTRLGGYELSRLQWPSRAEVLRMRAHDDPNWPTPEPTHRAQQMLIEPVLKRHAERYRSIDLRFGWRVEAIAQDATGVRVRARDLASDQVHDFNADYAVGCDGPRSLVRETLGIGLAGINAEDREFMGGRMLAIYLDAPDLHSRLGLRPSWQHWVMNPQRFGVLIAIDGRSRFVVHVQLPRGQRGSMDYAHESLALIAGKPFPYQIIGIAPWTAGFTLVAERYGHGRIFLAGDAAHLFTPTAGLGYNTSVDDVANLGWKLAAVCRGWGGPALLATYETERKPVAERNTRFARSIADFYRSLAVSPLLEEDSAAGAAARNQFGGRCRELSAREFNAPGVHFGALYGDSPIVAAEPGEPPPDTPDRYVPQARPGARAPHLWLAEGEALYDRFGRDFTLLKLRAGSDTRALETAAQARGVPLTVLELRRDGLRSLYASDLVLIRPDQHVSWRGDRAPEDGDALIARLVGAEGACLATAGEARYA